MLLIFHMTNSRSMRSASRFFHRWAWTLGNKVKTSSSYRVPQLKLYNSRRLFFHLLNNFLLFKIHFHILQIWTFYDISSFFDLLLQKLVFFKKINFFLFFSKKIKKFFLKIFCLKCLLIIFETQLWSKFHDMCFKNDEFSLQTENFQKKKFFGKKWKKNFLEKTDLWIST